MQPREKPRKLRQVKLPTLLKTIDENTTACRAKLGQAEELFIQLYDKREHMIPYKVSVEISKSNCLGRQLLRIKKEESEHLQMFLMASDEEAHGMQAQVSRLKTLSDSLRAVKDRLCAKFSSMEEHNAKLGTQLADLKRDFKDKAKENLELYMRLKRLSQVTVRKPLAHSTSLDTMFFSTEPQQQSFQQSYVESQDKAKDYSKFIRRIKKRRLEQLIQKHESAIKTRCLRVERKLQKAAGLSLLLDLLGEKKESYRGEEALGEIGQGQLRCKRLFYRFLFSPGNIEVVEQHILSVMEGKLQVIPQVD